MKYDKHLDSTTDDEPVKYQNNRKSLNPNLAASRLHEISG